MLKESQNIRQTPGENFRRWFSDDHFDLITWQTISGELSAFQLCFDKTGRERAIVWQQGQPLEHYLIDSGEPGPRHNLAPIMLEHPIADLPLLLAEFKSRTTEIDPTVRDFVLTTLQTHLNRSIAILGDDSPGGIYLLRVYLEAAAEVVFGRHRGGTPIPLPHGEYLYIGSALSARGANSLASRLLRHATRGGSQPPHQLRDTLHAALADAGLTGKLPAKKTVRWHIDYLLELPNAQITAVLALRTTEKLEKPLAEQLAAFPETQPVSPGLGASDHPGHSHLFFMEGDPGWWERVVNDWERYL
jgi:Uri superfamily endonuclease